MFVEHDVSDLFARCSIRSLSRLCQCCWQCWSLQHGAVSRKVVDAPGILRVAPDKFGILSVEPILDACSTPIFVPDKLDALSVAVTL